MSRLAATATGAVVVLPDIAAVGGTSLHRSADGAWTEQAWGNGANSLLGGGARLRLFRVRRQAPVAA
jgi:hypothetical protein